MVGMVLEDAVATPNKYDFGLINDKNTIHLPRQEFGERRRKLVFSRDSGVAVGEFGTDLGQNWWKKKVV